MASIVEPHGEFTSSSQTELRVSFGVRLTSIELADYVSPSVPVPEIQFYFEFNLRN